MLQVVTKNRQLECHSEDFLPVDTDQYFVYFTVLVMVWENLALNHECRASIISLLLTVCFNHAKIKNATRQPFQITVLLLYLFLTVRQGECHN